MNDYNEATWKRVQSQLEGAVDAETFALWLGQIKPLRLDGTRLQITAPPASRQWLQERFGALIRDCARAVLGPEAEVQLVDPESADAVEIGAEYEVAANAKLTFEQFVIGDGNRLAHAAALTVAELPSDAYNPLFICGPPGVGKTHLLNAIATFAKRHNPDLGVRMTTGETFTNDFLAALSSGSTDRFKSRFRDIDMLLLDDVQFLERKAKTEEEFFHTFNALHEVGRQIVLTSDRAPADLDALETRLRQRFQGGLVADIAPPDFATRLTILGKRAASDGVVIDDELVLPAIARRVTDNVRDLEGALIRVVAYASLTGRSVTLELAEEVLDALHHTSRAREAVTLPGIQSATCAQFGLTTEELLSQTRSRRVLWPRQVAMYLSRELTGESLPTIGRAFAGRDHTTVLNACKRTAQLVRDDEPSRLAVEKLRATLVGGDGEQ
ncbi:MAG TPA: chromosomal replication initiator protein DnaA [Solirubrobacteraceae bacterium]|nr:chromosomal replication initiator protein DnaA [Solirubrobacteraceae bacterium]